MKTFTERKPKYTSESTRADTRRMTHSFSSMQLENQLSPHKLRPDGCIQVGINCKLEEGEEFYSINVNPSRTIDDLIKVAVMKLGSKYYGIHPKH